MAGKIQIVRYKLPISKVFNMAFPEPIKLTAGMQKTLDVSFRPVKLVNFQLIPF